jgi:hypothetical protein
MGKKTKKTNANAEQVVSALQHADGRYLEFRIKGHKALLGSYLAGRGVNLQRLDRATARTFYRRALDGGFKATKRNAKARKAINEALGAKK